MRANNIQVTFRIPVPIDTPDMNGNFYTADAIENACLRASGEPIVYIDDSGASIIIGMANKCEFDKDEKTIIVNGVIRYGGTSEQVAHEFGLINEMKIVSFGIVSK